MPQMAFLMGVDNSLIWTLSEDDMQEVTKILPQRAMISDDDFRKIKEYYSVNAPEKLLLAEAESAETLQQFATEEYSLPSPYPSVTHVSFDSSTKTFL